MLVSTIKQTEIDWTPTTKAWKLTSYFTSKYVVNLKPKHRNAGPKNLNVSKGAGSMMQDE